MPIYSYEVLNGKGKETEVIEVEQSSNDPPLTSHPITGQPLKRIISSPSLTLRHSSIKEKKLLSEENLIQKGFMKYQKNKDTKRFERIIGNNGPERI